MSLDWMLTRNRGRRRLSFLRRLGMMLVRTGAGASGTESVASPDVTGFLSTSSLLPLYKHRITSQTSADTLG
ncbi:hypothetical protein NIIDMKKI_21140 [Mycobacterium kansasii]|uniref:Uncharacterized protein n=3 Tax=Mycobacterium kansasii TaxID=1768 RepID=A0A7G1IEJ1_MYCKA|nr:hypothetical protein NIIDMKKI_21140 [Mycobacterium kansasii]